MRIQPCHSRRSIPGEESLFFCAHPDINVRDQVVSPEICRICSKSQLPPPAEFREMPAADQLRRTADGCFFLGAQTDIRACQTCQGTVRIKYFECHHVLHGETSLSACLHCPDYESKLTRGRVRDWAVGMTTAPREQPTIQESLRSLAEAGWDSVLLFAEPDSLVPDGVLPGSVIQRGTRLGAFPNWYLSLTELYLRAPHADAYFLCQDDAIFARGLRSYLEDQLWPNSRLGVVSVYCPMHHARRAPEGFHAETRGWETWGALAYIFPNAGVRSLLSHPHVVNHRFRGPEEGQINIDSVVGRWCLESELPYYVHIPSLVQHVGKASTLFAGAGCESLRAADRFVGEIRSPDSGMGHAALNTDG